jgi:lactoylglutathione lyase
MDIIHHAVWVSDVEKTLDFYVDELGLEKTKEFVSGDGARNVYVAGENSVEIQFKHEPDRDIGPGPNGPFDHVAIEVDDIDGELNRLVEKGSATLVRGPLDSEGANARVAFIEDPAGYGIELVEEFD